MSKDQQSLRVLVDDFTGDDGVESFRCENVVSRNFQQIGATVTVSVKKDRIVEPDETLLINLTNPLNATIGDGSGVGTIFNDD